MTRALSAGFRTHLDLETTELTTCIYLRRRDGTEFRFTELDIDLVLTGTVTDSRGRVMDGTYLAAQGETPSGIDASGAMAVDNLEIVTILSSGGITEADMAAGLWDYADFNLFQVVRSDVTLGVMWLMSGKLGEVSVEHASDLGTAELRSKSVLLQETFGRLVTHECPVDLASPECKPLGAVAVRQGSTAYSVGDRVRPSIWERVEFVCTTAGTTTTVEPLWSLGLGTTTTDGSVVWTAYSPLKPAAWTSAHAYAVGEYVSPSTFNKRLYRCTTAGTSGGGEPSWDTTIGNTTADGSVVWTAQIAWLWEGTVTTATDQANFEDTSLSDASAGFADGWFKYGLLTWVSGSNAGIQSEVKTFTESGGVVALWAEMPYEIQVGDTYVVEAGCDKARSTCRDKFSNVENFRGFAWVPGRDALYQTPGSK